MPEDMVTCPYCGTTFPIGIPRGKRIVNYRGIGFFEKYFITQYDIHFSCPNCSGQMGAKLEDFCCKKYDD